MKVTTGVFAVLLLAASVAVGQQHASYAEPFPQSANPALANGTVEESSAVISDMPSSMAISQNGTYVIQRDRVDLGSPFPQAANPSLGNGTAGESFGRSTADGGSPFPNAANPSR
ncbi:MAG TPA: hypothetical protein VEK84_07415 [Terriglobales bacterium]|nr:hypothetical protein [Terriglobales bacterium]